MDPQDCLVTSSEDVLFFEKGSTSAMIPQYQKKKNRKKKSNELNEKFPWLQNFLKTCHSTLGRNSIKVLLNLMTVYTQHVSRDVVASYSKPNRAAKLKKNMIDVLGFFHNTYISIKSPLEESVYMEKMSNLLTMYMDMEIKASRRGKENVKKITSKIISSLFIFLNNSSEYILDTILRARFTVKSYNEICIPIFKKVASLAVSQDLTYVRCLLVFKLWKRLVPRGEERNALNRLAVSTLSPPPPQLLEMVNRGMLKNVLPTLPNKKPTLVTRFYMTSKINLRDSIKAFLKISSEFKLNEFSTTLDPSRFFDAPFEQESFLLCDKEKDDFMESIWKNISDASPTLSDSSAPLDLMPSGDSPKSSNKKNNSKENKKMFNNKTDNNHKIKLKSKKQGKKGKKQPSELSNTKILNFPNLPSEFLEKIKFISNNIDREEPCGKSSPSSTVNDDCEIKKQGKNDISQRSPMSLSDLQFVTNNNQNSKESVEGRGGSNSSNEDNKFTVQDKENDNRISQDCIKYNEDNSELVVKSAEKSDFKQSSPDEIKVDDSSKEIIVKDIKLPDCVETSNLETGLLNISQSVKNDCQPVNNCIKNQTSQSSNFDVNDVSDIESFSKFHKSCETIISREEVETTNNNIVSISQVASSSEEKDYSKISPSDEAGVNNNLELCAQREVSKTYNTAELFVNDQHSYRVENSNKNLSEPDTLNCTSEEDPSVKQNESMIADRSNSVILPETINRNNMINNGVGLEEISSSYIECIPKYNAAELFVNDQHSYRVENSNKNPSEPDTLNCTSEEDPSVKQNESMIADRSNSVILPETINRNNMINNGVGLEEISSSYIECIPKSQPVRSDCMFDKSNVQLAKTDYSICSLLKPQVIIKNEQGIIEYDLDKPGMHGNIFVKKEFSICSRDTNEQHFSPKPSSVTIETETNQNCDGKFQDAKDEQDCNENLPLSYSSHNRNITECSNYGNTPDHGKAPNCENAPNKDLNSCLLHKILGEEDCPKNASSECLFGKTNLEKSLSNDCIKQPESTVRQDYITNSISVPNHISLNHLQNTSDLIKNHTENEKVKSFGSIRPKIFSKEQKSSDMEYVESSMEVFPKENEVDNTEFVLRNECDNFNSTFEYESEDSNLVIDEDFDPVKEPHELYFDETSDVNEPLRTSTPDPRKVCEELKITNVPLPVKQSLYPEVKKPSEIPSSGKEILCETLSSSGHSLDFKENFNTKSSDLSNFCVNENMSLNISGSKAGLCHSRKREHSVSLPERNTTNIKTTFRENAFSPPRNLKVVDFKTLQNNKTYIKKPQNPEKSTSFSNLQGSSSVSIPVEQSISPKFSTDANPPSHTESRYSNFQHHQITQPMGDNVISVNNSLLVPNLSTVQLVQEINRYGSYSNYSPKNKECEPINSTKLPPFEQFHKLKPVVNEKYHNINVNTNPHEKLSNFKTYQNSTMNYVANELHSGVNNHIQSGHPSNNLKRPSSIKHKLTYSKKQKKVEAHQKMQSSQLHDINPVQNPLCLVVTKNKDVIRESLYDYVFPVAQEIEVCSASDDFVYPGSSEITHPDWPVADELSVIDSSSSIRYSPSTDQYLYSSNLKSDQYCGTSENDNNCSINTVELQQVSVDFRCPENVDKGFNKEKVNLHKRTQRVDYDLCCSQRKFKEFYLSQNLPPTIPVPYPVESRTDIKSSIRCVCEQCSDNHKILLSNYNVLTNFQNSKVKTSNLYSKTGDIYSSDRDLSCESDCSFDSSLPLKKRKALTNSKPTNELTSYPNTPMMSIAQLELANYEQRNQVIVTNPQRHWKDALDPRNMYLPPCPSIGPTVPDTDTKQCKRKPGKRRKSSR